MLLFNVKSFPGHYPMCNIRKLEKKIVIPTFLQLEFLFYGWRWIKINKINRSTIEHLVY